MEEMKFWSWADWQHGRFSFNFEYSTEQDCGY
jgi:hypothetical protein